MARLVARRRVMMRLLTRRQEKFLVQLSNVAQLRGDG